MKLSCVLAAALLFPGLVFGQGTDTLRTAGISLYEPYVQPYLPSRELQLSAAVPLTGDAVLDLLPPLTLSGSMRWLDLGAAGRQEDLRAYMMTPYLLERQREEELTTLKYVLGTIQVGGAAYLAYRYLKKHGLK